MGSRFERVIPYGHRNTICFCTITANSSGNAVRQRQQHRIYLIRFLYIILQSGGDAVALGLLWLRKDRGRIDTIGIVMDVLAHLHAHYLLDFRQIYMGKISDGYDLGMSELICSRSTNSEQLSNWKRPHLRFYFIRK